jgi:2-methylaconitate cis-trans-isomerase PrpF
VPLTLALCLGAAVKMPGTIPNQLVAQENVQAPVVTIGHPSGKVDIGTTVRDGKIISVDLLRTARVLMKGDVFY